MSYAFEHSLELSLSAAMAAWQADDGSAILGEVDCLPGHSAFPRIFGLEDAATDGEGVPGGEDLTRLRRPLVSIFGRASLAYGGEVSAEIEVAVRSPWSAGIRQHAFLVSAVRTFAEDARSLDLLAEVAAWVGAQPAGDHPWTLYGLSWGEDDTGQARWENGFDGWHWVSTGVLYARGNSVVLEVTEYLRDADGNYVLDADGNRILVYR